MPVEKAIKSGFVDVPGARFYYEIAGEGDPVVLLHGGLLDRRMWDGQFPFFAQRYQTIRFDMRCSGESQSLPSAEPYVPSQVAYHLLQALSSEGCASWPVGRRAVRDRSGARLAWNERLRVCGCVDRTARGRDENGCDAA